VPGPGPAPLAIPVSDVMLALSADRRRRSQPPPPASWLAVVPLASLLLQPPDRLRRMGLRNLTRMSGDVRLVTSGRRSVGCSCCVPLASLTAAGDVDDFFPLDFCDCDMPDRRSPLPDCAGLPVPCAAAGVSARPPAGPIVSDASPTTQVIAAAPDTAQLRPLACPCGR